MRIFSLTGRGEQGTHLGLASWCIAKVPLGAIGVAVGTAGRSELGGSVSGRHCGHDASLSQSVDAVPRAGCSAIAGCGCTRIRRRGVGCDVRSRFRVAPVSTIEIGTGGNFGCAVMARDVLPLRRTASERRGQGEVDN